MKTVRRISSAAALSVIAISGFAQETTETLTSTDLVITGANVVDVVYTRRLGGGEPTQIYKAGGALYYEPALLPEWREYQNSVDAACTEETDDQTDVSIPLTIFLNDVYYETDILEGLQDRTDLASSSDRLYVIPYDIARIRMRVDGEDRVVYPRDTSYLAAITSGYSESRRASLPEEVSVVLSERCDIHRRILADMEDGKSDLISGELYRVDPGYTSTSLHMVAALGLDEQIKAELFSDESVEASVSSNNQGSSFSLNVGIGDLFGTSGSGRTDATATATGRRLVTRDVLDEMTSRVVESSWLECSGVDCAELIKQALPVLIEREGVTAILARTGDGWAVLDDQLNYVTMTSGKISGDLSTIVQSTGEQTNNEEVTLPGGQKVNTEDIRKAIANFTGNGSVTLEGPVAVVADLAVISRDTINYRMDVSISQSIPVDGEQNLVMVRFRYPAVPYAEGRVADAIRRSDDETLRERCESGAVRISRTQTDSARSPSQHSPYQEISVTAQAENGYYIESSRSTHSGSNSDDLRSSYSLMRLGPDRNISVDGVFEAATHVFKCHRGNNPIDRRRCTITGNVHTFQQPMQCARYLIDNYRILVGLN